MTRNRIRTAIVLAVAALVCSCDRNAAVSAPECPDTMKEGEYFPSVIEISLEGDDTKTGYSYLDDGRLKTIWKDGDAVFVAPAFTSSVGTTYRVRQGGASTGTFVADAPISVWAKGHAFYYPGQKIHNDITFMNFSYLGQVQKKSDPMAHMAEFHSMRKAFAYTNPTNAHYNPAKESFSGCDQSGCIMFLLSGRSFVNPTRVELTVYSGENRLGNLFFTSNKLDGYYPDSSTADEAHSPKKASSLSIDLEGYGTEDHLAVYMMHTNADMPLPAGCTLRVSVIADTCCHSDILIPDATAIKGGYASTISVNGGWVDDDAPLPPSGDYTQYPWDGEVVTLQEGGQGLDLVIMGDGFIRADFEDGTYDAIMRQASDAFLSVLPLSLFRGKFNVYYVKVPSPERVNATETGSVGAQNSGTVTKFSTQFTPNSTHISGDDGLAREYAKKAFGTNANERIKDATIIVMVNQECRAGTCWNSWNPDCGKDYGQACAVAYCALGNDLAERIGLVRHEAAGHGFGKLADEYTSDGTTTISATMWRNLDDRHALGLFRNTDKYVTENLLASLGSGYSLTTGSNVYWRDLFGTENCYESQDTEALGVYEGGNTYRYFFCRPTEDNWESIMGYNTGRFNAVSRRQIYYRYRRLTGQLATNCYGTAAELNAFLDWDRQYFDELYQTVSEVRTKAPCVERHPIPDAPAVLVEGHWVDGVFYEGK